MGQRVDVRLDDGVRQTIEHGVNTEAEHVLVIVRVDARSYDRAVWRIFALGKRVDLQDTSKTDLELDRSVLVKEVVPDVLCPSVSKG